MADNVRAPREPAPHAVPADPCPQCMPGGTCNTMGCGRRRSSLLMEMHGVPDFARNRAEAAEQAAPATAPAVCRVCNGRRLIDGPSGHPEDAMNCPACEEDEAEQRAEAPADGAATLQRLFTSYGNAMYRNDPDAAEAIATRFTDALKAAAQPAAPAPVVPALLVGPWHEVVRMCPDQECASAKNCTRPVGCMSRYYVGAAAAPTPVTQPPISRLSAWPVHSARVADDGMGVLVYAAGFTSEARNAAARWLCGAILSAKERGATSASPQPPAAPSDHLAIDAVLYVVRRIKADPRLAWLIGPGSETYDRLKKALVSYVGSPEYELCRSIEENLKTTPWPKVGEDGNG